MDTAQSQNPAQQPAAPVATETTAPTTPPQPEADKTPADAAQPKADSAPTVAAPQATPEPDKPATPSKKSNPMKKILMIVVMIIILAGVAVGAYFMGSQKMLPIPMMAKTYPTPTPAGSITPVVTPTPTPVKGLTWGGGVSSLKKYSIKVPDGWTVSRTAKNTNQGVISEELTITIPQTGDYSITILQGPGDGGACSYPDKKVTTGIIAGDYKTFVEFKDQDGVSYRRGSDGLSKDKPGTTKYTVCQMGKDAYGNLTSYGWLSYWAPKTPDETSLKQLDAILATLKAQ